MFSIFPTRPGRRTICWHCKARLVQRCRHGYASPGSCAPTAGSAALVLGIDRSLNGVGRDEQLDRMVGGIPVFRRGPPGGQSISPPQGRAHHRILAARRGLALGGVRTPLFSESGSETLTEASSERSSRRSVSAL